METHGIILECGGHGILAENSPQDYRAPLGQQMAFLRSIAQV